MQTVDREIVRKEFIEQTGCPLAKMRLPDRDYPLPTVREIRDLLDEFDAGPYVPEHNDCDNKAAKFMVYCSDNGHHVAWISIGPHDMNAFVERETMKIWYVEPSQGLIFPVTEPVTWMVIP